jgi:hypothetical protein
MAKSSQCRAASDRKKKVDRGPVPARFVELGGREMLVGHHELPVGRNDIDMARFNGSETGNLRHGHSRSSGENAGELALAARVELHDDNECRFDILW